MAVTESNNPTEAGDQTQSPVSQIYVRANPFSKLTQQSLRRPECLVEPTGRRVVIVISDCVAEMWRTSEMLRVLQLWAQQGPLVILQMMPEWLWHRTSLNQASLVILKGQAVGTANTDLAIAQSLSARRRTNLQKNEDIPVPVITLEPERFGQWTDLLTLRGEKQAPGVIFSYRNQKAAATLRKRQQQKQPNQSPNALKRTQAFQGAASPMARRLASLLAASPVISLPVIRMVQDSLLPQSKPVHVAEVLLGGILKPEKEPEPDTDPDDVVYRFVDEEIRKQLLANAPVPDTTEVLSSYIRKRFDRALHEFVAYLRDLMEQAGTEQDQIRPFATVTAAVLQYRGDNPAFTDFVEAVQQRYGTVRQARENPSPDTLDEAQSQSEFPPLQEYDYEVAKVSFEEETPSFTLQTQTLEIGTLEITSESDVVDLPQTGLEPFEFVSATIARQNSEWRIQNRTDRAYRYVERIEKQRGFIASLFRSPEEVELEMVAIPAGEFRMGAPTDESTSESEKPQHTVSVPAFFMSKYLITQAQWQAVAGWEQVNRELESEPSRFKGENLPVEQVSWHEAVEFCDRISARTGRTYRLPTEAEWEYACRAGTQTPFHFGETITAELANYRSEIAYNDGPTSKGPDKTTDVGRYPANGFGLYDMHGNLWEWCLDDYHNNYEEAPTDGSTWLSSSERKSRKVLRGGSWFGYPENCRSAYRYYYGPDLRDNHLGFRVVCLPQDS
ncbi:MAG: formylglycine-generating enzyme family protein [Cyanobacteria bacterium J06629_9]